MPFHMKQNRVVLTKLYLGNSSKELISTRSCRIKGKPRFWKIPSAQKSRISKRRGRVIKNQELEDLFIAQKTLISLLLLITNI